MIDNKTFFKQLGVAEKLCGRVQLVLDQPYGYHNLDALRTSPIKKNLEFTIHGPFLYADCLSFDVEYRKASIKQIFETILTTKKLDCDQLVLHLGRIIDVIKPTKKYLPVLKQSLDELGDFAKQEGVSILIENLPPSKRALISYPSSFEELKEVSSLNKNFDFCLDVGHAALCNIDSTKLLRFFGKKLKNVHIHDANGVKDHLPIGQGDIDFVLLKKNLDKMKYSNGIDIEILDFEKTIEGFNQLTSIGY